MRKKLLMAIALLVSGVGNLWADDVFKDVTSNYLTNADFEGSCGVHSYPTSSGSNKRAIYKPDNWTLTYTSGNSNDMSCLNDTCLQWSQFSGKAQLATGGKNTYWIRMGWGSGQTLELSQKVSLPLGKYTLTAAYYKNGKGGESYIFAGSTTNYASGNEDSWRSVTVTFDSNGSSAISLGGRISHTSQDYSNPKFVGYDNFVLKWNLTQSLDALCTAATTLNGTLSDSNLTAAISEASGVSSTDADELELAYYKLAWNMSLAKAKATLDNDTYSNVTGSEKADLETEIAKSEPTTCDGYNDAITAIESAESSFIVAKGAYDYYKEIKDENTAMGATTLAVEPTTEEEATAGANTLKVNQYNYVSENYTGDVTDLYVGTWSTKTNFDEVTNNEHWSGNSTKYFNKWAASGTTSTLSQILSLPAGSYALRVAGRGTGPVLSFSDGTTTKNFQLLGGEGLGINLGGEASYDAEDAKSFANTTGRGWEWRFIKLTLGAPTDVTVTLQINRSTGEGWGSFADFTVLATPLTESLNRYNLAYSAATAAKANGTYANVLGGSEEAALTAAIAADGSLDKTKTDDLDEATSTLTTATTNFTDAVTNYDRLAAAIDEASSISYDGSSYAVTSSTDAAGALSKANTLYASMLNDQKTAKAKKTLGFEKDEYAPYNNVAILAAWDKADAITSVAEATTSELNAAITALYGANWSDANAAEVNAVCDGTFKAAENNGAPAGWTMTDNTLGGGTHARAYVGNDKLVEFNETKSAFYIRFDGYDSSKGSLYYYGKTEGYTMPLKANTWYHFTADFASWGSTYGPLRINVSGPSDYATSSETIITSNDADASDDYTPQKFDFFFKTNVAGNYNFNIQNVGASTAHKAVITNIELFKCPAASATMTVKANKWGTFIAPFDVDIPSDVYAYRVTNVDGTTLVKSDAISTTIPANTPVILENTTASDVNEEFNGQNISTADSYTSGLLTGVYKASTIAASDGDTRYVLQTPTSGANEGIQAFYKVTSDFTATANRCYLTVPGGGSVKAFFFDGDETAVSSVKADELQGATIYNLAGQRVSKAQKGVYIINGKKVAVK